MLSDPAKLVALAICMVVCLGTLFTSPSITMGNSTMNVMNPQVRNHCLAARKAASKCSTTEGSTDSQCPALKNAAVKCESVVKRAYRHINLGGCPSEIKSVTLCEAEWCNYSVGALLDQSSCNRECSNVRQNLKSCMEEQVAFSFRQSGFEKDGTLTVK